MRTFLSHAYLRRPSRGVNGLVGFSRRRLAAALADVPNLYGTHHIGASTDQAQTAVAEETVRIVREFKNNGQVINAVN